MSSLADQVKQLVAMGISPNEALAAVTAERERQGKTQGQKEKEELSSHSKWSLDKAGSGSTTKPPSPPKTSVSGGRPGLQKPLSYNRPGMLTHVHEESEILPGISPPMRKMRSNDQQDNSMQDIWKDKSTSSPKTSPLDSPAKEKSRGKSRDETSDNRISSRSKASPKDNSGNYRNSYDTTVNELVEIDRTDNEEKPAYEKLERSKFVNKSDSNGVLESQRALTAEFSSENSFLPISLLPLKSYRAFWRSNVSSLSESVSADIFLQKLKMHLTEVENIHKSEAKLCISNARNILEKLDLNSNNQISLLQLKLFLKPFEIEMSILDSLLKQEREEKSLLFLAPPLPARYIPLKSSVDVDIFNAMSQPGFTRVLGPASAGKTIRILAACHQLASDVNCLWIDFTAEISSQSDAISQLASELGLSGNNNYVVLQQFRKLLSVLSPQCVVVLDHIDTTECATACSTILSICAEHNYSFLIISRTSEQGMVVPSIPLVDEKECGRIHIGPLSSLEATRMATVFSNSDSTLLSECSEYLPGNILALGTLSSTYLQQLAHVPKKNPHVLRRETSDLLMRSFDESQKICAHCLAPLMYARAYVSEECLWYLCREEFQGNKGRWSDAVNGLEKMGWLRASLCTEDYMVVGDRLPTKDNAPALFKQCTRYYDFWAKRLNMIHEAHQAGLVPTSTFEFDRYRSHFNRLLFCWGEVKDKSKSKSSILLASFGLLGSNYARDVAHQVAGNVATFCAIRFPPPDCVDICCDVFTIIEHKDKKSLAYLLSSLDLARMLLLNNQMDDSLELSTELVAGIKNELQDTHNKYHFLLGSGLSVLAQIYESSGQHENAIETYNNSINSLGLYYGLESREYAIAEHSLGHIYRLINDLDKAELCYKRALERFKTCHGRNNDHQDIACVLNDLASIYKLRGDNKKAFEKFLEVQRIRATVLGKEHIETANSMNSLAFLLHAECKYDEAKPYYQGALVIYKNLLGDLDPDVAAALNNLGTLHDDLGDYEEARSYYESSLAIRKAVLRDDHPDLAASLGNLAALLDDNGDITAAKELYKQTLEVTRNIYGNNHADIASTLVNIAALEDEQGNLAEAKQLYEEAVSIFIGLHTEVHADVASTLTCLANVAKLQDDDSAVRSYFGRVIAIYKQLHGGQSAEVANAMTSFGVYLFNNGTTNMGESSKLNDGNDMRSQVDHVLEMNNDRAMIDDDDDGLLKHSSSATVQLYEESSQYLEEALQIRKDLYGSFHADVATSLKNIGWLRKVQRHFPEAISSYEEALKVCEKLYKRHHPEVAECLSQLGILNKFQNKFKEAISYFEEAIRILNGIILEDSKNRKKYSLQIAANFASLAIVHKGLRNYSNAVECYKECFEIQVKALGHDNAEVAKTLHALGLVTWYLGNERAAKELLEEALDIRRKVLPDRHPDIIQSLSNLHDLLGENHKYDESMRKYAEAIARIEKTVGPDHPDLAVDLLNMALMAYEMGKYNEAIPLFERGLSIRIKAFGEEHELVAEYLLAIANLHVKQRQFRESKYEFEGALKIIEEKVGRQSREYAVGLSQFAKCLQVMCKFEEAIPIINEALVIFRSAVLSVNEGLSTGERNGRSLDLSNILMIGADVFAGSGDYAAAEPYYEEAIEIMRKVLGDDNIQVATTLMSLASVLKSQQFYDDAKNAYLEALQIRRQCLGIHVDVVEVLNYLGDLGKRLGDLDGSLMYYEEALVIREQLLGEYHQDVAQSVHAVAAIYDLKGDFVEAERLFQRALILRRKSLGDMHPDVAQTLNNLAAILDDMNRADEAEAFYVEALAIYKEVYGYQHPDVALSLNNLAALLDDKGDHEAALKLYEEALVITKQIYGKGSLEVAAAQICVANSLKQLKRFLEAEKLYQSSLEIKVRIFGENHLNVAATKVSFAELYAAEGEVEDAKVLLGEAVQTHELLLGADNPEVIELRNRAEQLRLDTSVVDVGGEAKEGDINHNSAQTIHSMEAAIRQKQLELGNDNVAVAELSVQLATALVSKDRYHDALQKFREALRIFRVNYSRDDPVVIVTLDKVIGILCYINEFNEALPLLLEIIEAKAKVHGEASPSLAESLTELGFVYDRLGNLGKAHEIYVRALDIKRITLGSDSVEVGQALNSLGAILDDLGDSAAAEPYYREGLAIFRAIYGPDSVDVLLSLNNLAALLDDRGYHDQAKEYYEEALEITKRLYGEGSMEHSASIICLAGVMKKLEQYELAASFYDMAAQINESLRGVASNDVAVLYDEIGCMYVKLKWYEMGVNVFSKAYEIRLQLYGERHPQLVQSLEFISDLQAEWEHPDEAMAMLQEALQIRITQHGGRVASDVADILVKLAALERKNKKPRNALTLLNEALTTYRQCHGSKHDTVANTLSAMASIYKGFRKYNEATKAYRKAMLIRESIHGDNSLGVAEIIVSLGTIKEKQQIYEEALCHYEDALNMYSVIYHDQPHTNIARIMTSIATILKQQRMYDKAKDYYDRALDMQKALHSGAHTDIAQSMNNLASLLYSMHNYTEAKILYEDSLAMLIQLLGNENLDVAQAMNNLAALLFAKKCHNEAESLYQESLRIRRLLLGPDHLDVASSLCNLGILKRSRRDFEEAKAYFQNALDIRLRILKDDNHPDVRVCKKHLSFLKQVSVVVEIGMLVEMNDRSSGQTLTGQVVKKHHNNFYDVKFDDPEMEIATNIPRNRLAVVTSPRKGESSNLIQHFSPDKGKEIASLSDSSIQRDRVLSDFQRAGSKVVRRKKTDEQKNPAMLKPQAATGENLMGSSSSSTSSNASSMSSNSDFEEILEKSNLRIDDDEPVHDTSNKEGTQGYTKLKGGRTSRDESKTSKSNGITHHVSSHHLSSKSSTSNSNNLEDNQSGDVGRSRYRESVGVTASRRSKKSFRNRASEN